MSSDNETSVTFPPRLGELKEEAEVEHKLEEGVENQWNTEYGELLCLGAHSSCDYLHKIMMRLGKSTLGHERQRSS